MNDRSADAAVPDDTAESVANIPNNVFALRVRSGETANPGHPSGPRVPHGAPSEVATDKALAALRSSPSEPVVARALASLRPDTSPAQRAALAAVALGQLSIGLAWLVGKVPFGQLVGNPTAGHLSRDAALGVVLGTIGAIVAWRPRWSLSLVPVVGAIVAVQAIGLASDASSGQSGFHFEFPHVLAIFVGVLTFLVSRRRSYPRTSR